METPFGYPVIPERITVHLGRPEESARNVEVPFSDYIKNVASSEIYPTWPENAIRANIYAQISYALNRVYTEWYRSQGYDFDITNSTQYDQAYVPERDIFENISQIVDEIFNNYVRRQGSVEPYFTQYCNGTTSTCAGLSQWGTVELANQGYLPYEILRYYYGDDIDIVRNAPVQNVEESYPGIAQRRGMRSNNIRILQGELNRIAENYPAIPRIDRVNGVFGAETEEAVREAVLCFVGDYDQIPPMYSALKVNGRKLCDLARQGVEVERKPRPVKIYDITIRSIRLPEVVMTVSCSKGTYIRTLCHDIGEKLAVGGCMKKLLRTRAAGFRMEDSRTLDELQALKDTGRLEEAVLPVETVFSGYKEIRSGDASMDRLLRNGNPFRFQMDGEDSLEDPFRVYDSTGLFIGIYRFSEEKRMFYPVKIFLS